MTSHLSFDVITCSYARVIMERWTGKVALVTGASAGIGAAISALLVKNGLKVIGCARNVAKIEVRKYLRFVQSLMISN